MRQLIIYQMFALVCRTNIAISSPENFLRHPRAFFSHFSATSCRRQPTGSSRAHYVRAQNGRKALLRRSEVCECGKTVRKTSVRQNGNLHDNRNKFIIARRGANDEHGKGGSNAIENVFPCRFGFALRSLAPFSLHSCRSPSLPSISAQRLS